MDNIQRDLETTEDMELLGIKNEQRADIRVISMEEIKELIQKKNFRRGFSIVDTNKDGRIDINELKQLIRSLGIQNIQRNFAKRIMEISDTNNDGYIDYNEFLNILNNKEITEVLKIYCDTYVNLVVPKRNITRKSRARAATFDVDEVDIRYEEQYTCWPPPIGMVTMSVIQLVLFCVDCWYGANNTAPGTVATYLLYDPSKRHEFQRFLSYMFVHIGYLHLTINLLVQLLLGIPLEMVHGSWRVLTVYLAGVLAGSLGTSLADPTVLLAGASGGVYSLITAHIASIIINWKEMTMAVVQLALFLIVTGLDFGTSIYNRYFLDVKQHIGYEAHFAGALAGLFVGIFILRNLEENSCEKKLWWISLFIFNSFILFAVIWNVAYPEYYKRAVF